MKAEALPSIAEVEQNSTVSPEDKEKLKALSRQFESVLINQMVGAMGKTINREEGLIPESQGEKVYRSMLESEYAQRLADSEQIGLSKMIYEHLLRTAARR